MDGVPPELERFAAEAVAEGRYRDLDQLVAAGGALLRDRDTARAAFAASVQATDEEANRDG